MPTRSPSSRWVSSAILALTAGWAHAAAPPSPRDGLQYQKVAFSVALGSSSFASLLRSDAAPGVPGTPLSGEDNLGLANRRTSGVGELTLRTRSRHRLRIGADFLALNRHGTATFDQPVAYGGSLYLPTDRAQSVVNLRRAIATYLYSPIRNERFELAAGLGVELVDFHAALAVDARSLQEKVTGTAPLPRMVVEGLWRVSPNWYLEGRAGYLQGTISKATVAEKALGASALWVWKPGVAFSIGYQFHDLEADSRFPEAPGRFHLRTSGPQVAVRVGF